MKKIVLSGLLFVYFTPQLFGQDDSSRLAIGALLDCPTDFNRESGSTQPCFKLSSVRIRFNHRENARLYSFLSLNPLATPDSIKTTRPTDEFQTNQFDPTYFLEDYAFVWSPRSNLYIAVEEHSGVTRLPNVSGLSLASPFTGQGWDQTAISMTMKLPMFKGTQVELVSGNGEGERRQNLDPQQYFAFKINSNFLNGLWASMGVSLDGNNLGSDEQQQRTETFNGACSQTLAHPDKGLGFSTSRLSFGLLSDGEMSATPGFKFGLGWQRTIHSDLNKDFNLSPNKDQLYSCLRIDPNWILPEDPSQAQASRITKTVMGVNASFRFMTAYFVGFDWQTRNIDTGDLDYFQTCDRFVGQSAEGCSSSEQSSIDQTSLTYGVGADIEEGLTLIFEYNTEEFDEVYNKLFYVADGDQASTKREVFNARISYLFDR